VGGHHLEREDGMVRRIASALALVAAIVVGVAASASAATPVSLVVPQGTAFGYLGHSCGGIQEKAYATGFDPVSGYPVGDVFMSTRCGGSGRGGGYHTTTYSAWASATWDLTGAFVSSQLLTTAPTVDPTFLAFDAYGNEVYNASNSAFLLLSPTFVPPARVIGISPSLGPASGGTSVTITGTGFTAATDVLFGTTSAASFVVDSDTSITAITPVLPAGTADVTVVDAGGTSATSSADLFTSYPQPTISGLIPDQGPVNGGTTVTIDGRGFTGATSVTFGDTPIGFTVDSDTAITVVTPASDSGVDSASVSVTTPGGTASGGQFQYVAGLAVTPAAGAPGAVVVITGGGFLPGESVRVRYGTGLTAPSPLSVALCTRPAASDGSFSCLAAIPTTYAGAPGLHLVQALGATSRTKETTLFLLTS
jgi:hypothetical protein